MDKKLTSIEQKKRDQGRRVKARLVAAGIKQVEIARSLGIDPTLVCHALRGQRKANRVRREIANRLKADIRELWPENNRAA